MFLCRFSIILLYIKASKFKVVGLDGLNTLIHHGRLQEIISNCTTLVMGGGGLDIAVPSKYGVG